MDITDINAVQALLLANIGEEEINVRELMNRGYYQGSNASYNLKKLVENGYLLQEKSPTLLIDDTSNHSPQPAAHTSIS